MTSSASFIAALLLASCAVALHSRVGLAGVGSCSPGDGNGGGVPCALPQWAPTYNMSRSTIFMPCNNSGFMDARFSSLWGIVDFDWSNGKADWANQKPMDCQERLLAQAKQVKALGTGTKVMVYRNLVKALPWYTDVREKVTDPAYAGWFLRFKDGAGGAGYHTPPCTGAAGDMADPLKCSDLYHDQDQTPEHPHGDGSCAEACDCGEGLPCGEYLWDHRNASLRAWLVEQYVMSAGSGVRNGNIDGIFLDDGWSNRSEPSAAWWPKEGFCSADAHGGATEEMANCTVDMGLGKGDVQAIYDAWRGTIEEVRAAIVGAGAYNYQMFASTKTPADAASCATYMRWACKPNATSWQASSALRYELTQPATSVASVARDVATFLLVRGPFAWIGHGWVGCAAPAHAPANETQYVRPAALDADYGDPVDATCAETAPGSGVFARKWSKASVSVDCNTLEGTIDMLA